MIQMAAMHWCNIIVLFSKNIFLKAVSSLFKTYISIKSLNAVVSCFTEMISFKISRVKY